MAAAALPYIVAVAGAVAQNRAQHQAADERRTILNRNMERSADASDKAAGMVAQEGQNYGVDQRNKQLADQEASTYKQAKTDIAGAGGSNISTAGDAGNVSNDFLREKADRAVTEGTRLTSIAREAAKNRAAGGLMNSDALRRANLAGGLQNLWGSTQNMNQATQSDAGNVQEPGYGLLGSIASAAGGAMAGSSGGGSGVNWDPDGSYSTKYARGIGR